MKFLYNISAFIIFIVLFNCKDADKTNTKIDKSVSSSKKEWKSLFNGYNLDGWTPKINGFLLGDNYNNTFRAEDSVIKVSYDQYDNFTDQFGHLFYKTPYSYYKLRLQYRFKGQQAKGGQSWATKNSGIMIHCQAPETMLKQQGFPISLEVQLLGGVTEGENRPSGNLCTPGTHVVMNDQLITEHCIPANCKTYYDEQWITAEVEVNRDSITHYIDGVNVISYKNPTIGGEYLDTTSKEIQDKSGQPLTKGYISLQSESHPIEFKNIEILEL
ncbi:hypothetical protein C7H62_0619 [Mesoflavibacter sp. HG96]|uniref:3-keto-disaccharide hydrolase n=1 Tax=Mesoflavibacter TaxID=444051 RepID=UPI000D0EDF07|nr:MULTISPECIES: DUF1080 domain-containing protein [Mesoflavibacter]QIJ88428.1 hypothetical protein C7H62_0619 [Mesoflavibacter sp. HG96]QIJ91156.1 hypothetical protein C7H56_0619 [Mesoflavibacter sp. HG37]